MSCLGCSCCWFVLMLVSTLVYSFFHAANVFEMVWVALLWFLVALALGFTLFGYGIGCVSLVHDVLQGIESKMKSIQMSNWKKYIRKAYFCTFLVLMLPVSLFTIWNECRLNKLLLFLLAVLGVMLAAGLIYPDFHVGKFEVHTPYNDQYMIIYSFLSVAAFYLLLYDGYKLLQPAEVSTAA